MYTSVKMRNANLFSKRTLSRNEDGILAKENILRPITICWERGKEGTSLNMTAIYIRAVSCQNPK